MISKKQTNVTNHVELRNAIERTIEAASLRGETKLPREMDFVTEYGVSRNMVRRALAAIAREGTIIKIKGTGTFISGSRNDKKPETRIIGLVVPLATFSAIARIIEGVAEILSAAGYTLAVENSGNSSRTELETIERLTSRHVDGIILYPSTDTRRSAAFKNKFLSLTGRNIPIAVLDREMVFADGSTPDVTVVASDNSDAVTRALGFLFDRGHRGIAFVNTTELATNSTYRERQNAYIEYMTRVKLPPHVHENAPFAYDIIIARAYNGGPAYRSIAASIAKDRGITAVLASDDITAYNLGQEFLKRGMRIPEDISIMGIGNVDFDFAAFGVTSIDQRLTETGRTAAREILSLAGKSGVQKRILITGAVVEKGSVRKIRFKHPKKTR
ncbi:MAG: substrate-binding domain-containing protein [Spirochaetes bacterium]|nr:substrate-binding domain-containing protein [Spirochaetota bacterium]